MPEKVHGGFNFLALAYPAFILFVAFVPMLFGRFSARPGDSGPGDDSGGGPPPSSPTPPPGPAPLPDAEQSRFRLRGPGSLKDSHRRDRRPARHPERSPARKPGRVKVP